MKPKVAFFDFAGCEGDQLQIANLEEEILTLLGQVDKERLLSLPLEADVNLRSLNRGDHRDVCEGGIADISLRRLSLRGPNFELGSVIVT